MEVSFSRIKLFKACRKAYQFRYIEDLVPVEKAEALQVGTNYHKLVEMLYSNNDSDFVLNQDHTKELAMVCAYYKYIYPLVKIKSTENWFEYDLGDGDKLIGRTDGITEDGYLVEHKTTGSEITEQYEYNLQWDEQILAYMLATGSRKLYYTICRKPNIRQRKDESDDDFFTRMIAWYDEDTANKIRLLEITRTDAEVEQFKDDLKAIIQEIKFAEEYPNRLYRNCGWCNVWGRRCEYSSICLNYDPSQQYVEFVKGEYE